MEGGRPFNTSCSYIKLTGERIYLRLSEGTCIPISRIVRMKKVVSLWVRVLIATNLKNKEVFFLLKQWLENLTELTKCSMLSTQLN